MVRRIIKLAALKNHLYFYALFFLSLLSLSISPIVQAATMADGLPISGNPNAMPSRFDQHFAALMRAWHVPGATVAIMKHGRLIMARGYGWSDMSSRQAMQPNALFRIASVSKTLTAVAILKLVQQHRLSLDDKAFAILNDLTPLNGRSINPRLYQITVRDLLQMSSGWYTEGPGSFDPLFGPWSSHSIGLLGGSIPPDCLSATRLMMGVPLQFRPGTRFSYSNLNYCMLGLIINKVNGQAYGAAGYQAYVRQNVLAPFGIQDMQMGRTQLYNRLPGEVKYYAYEVPGTSNIDSLPYGNSDILLKNYSDGGWLASAPSLARYLQALSTNSILNSRMMSIMLAKPSYSSKPDDYFSMGWTVLKFKQHRYWSKHGSFTGTIAQIIQRDDGTSYVALFNTQPGSKVQFINQMQRVLLSYSSGQ
jgi:N-acyl-D-amino-acid deacylase